MNTASAAESDYEFVQKLLSRIKRIERKRRLTPDEARPIGALQMKCQSDGEGIVMTLSQRDALLRLVRQVETRVKTSPYPPFR